MALVAAICMSTVGCRTLGTRGPNSEAVANCRHLTQQGTSAADRADWKHAESLLSRAVEACPVDVDARRRYAESLRHRGALADALEQMQQARRLSGEDTSLAVEIGELYMDMKQNGPASDMADLALRLDPKFAPAWALRGRVAAESGKLREALVYYQRSLGYAPEEQDVAIRMAEVYRQLNEPDRALLTLQSVTDRFSRGEEPQQVMFLEGLALAALGRDEDAAQRFAQAADRDRPTADILFHLAQTELQCGRFAGAQASLQRALAADPSHPASQALWSRMEAMAARPQAAR